MLAYAGVAALIAGSALVRADPVPTSPGPGDVFKQGEQCTLAWDVDTTGIWKEMNVELMTGDNLHMVHITTVATVDGTDPAKTTFSYPCPEVTPNSAIYFYQFSSPQAGGNLFWVTRFTIAAADGSTVPPENASQPDGQAIPWGVGALVDPSKAVPAPAYLTGGANNSTGDYSASSSATGQPGTTTITPAQSPSTSTPSAPSAPAAPSSSSTSASNASTTGTPSGAGSDNGALSAFGVDNYLARAGIALGVAAFTFAVAL